MPRNTPTLSPEGKRESTFVEVQLISLIVKLLDNENFHLRTELLLQVQIEINSNQLTQNQVFKLYLR